MNLLLIYNPQAGNGRAAKLLNQVKAYLSLKNLNANIQLTKKNGHAIDLVANADFSKIDAVIAAGGDGTLFEVLNGYFKNIQKQSESSNILYRPSLGLIPNGTGNAFMKELKLDKADWKKAIDIIARNQIKTIDVGHLRTQNKDYYFLNMVGTGFVSNVVEATLQLKWLGKSAYTAATLLKLVKLQSQKMLIEADERVIECDGIFAEVANSTYTGSRFFMAPKAKLDDGLLDLIILKKVSRLKLLRLFNSIYDGSHINSPEIEYIQAKKIKITEEKPGKLIPDGEILGQTPVEFECLAKAIDFLWCRH